ncbi:TolB family protein [Kitasatospora sp. NPDC057223]|uniref:TolB family protein n=1 Tax=Kitasatospora sp. NPDC057223 TaxID=3346055 RepID=UPI0036323D68
MPSEAVDNPAVTQAPEAVAAVETSAPATPAVRATARNGLIAARMFLDPSRATSAIATLSPDGSGANQLTRPPTGTRDDHPDWSPDGLTIAFDRIADGGSTRLWTVAATGGEPLQIPQICQDGAPDCLNESEATPAWSPDGKLIAFGRDWGTVDDQQNQIQYSDLFVMNADGTNAQRLTMLTNDKPYSGGVRNPSWSPDGTQLTFEYRTGPGGQPANSTAIFVVNADGTGQRQLTPWALRAGDRAGWSPDGSRILFTTYPDGPTGSDFTPGGGIYTVQPDGSAITALTPAPSNSFYGPASFSPDGQLIAFAQAVSGAAPEIYTMKTDGTAVTQATSSPEQWESRPAWGPAAG